MHQVTQLEVAHAACLIAVGGIDELANVQGAPRHVLPRLPPKWWVGKTPELAHTRAPAQKKQDLAHASDHVSRVEQFSLAPVSRAVRDAVGAPSAASQAIYPKAYLLTMLVMLGISRPLRSSSKPSEHRS